MITYQVERLFEVVDEVDGLLEMHYAELTLNKDRVKLKPIWRKYGALEEAGAFALHTARSDDMLIGYSAFFIVQHMHYEDLMVAQNDVLFLHPDYRRGSTGIKLIKFSESKLHAMGVDKVTWHVKLAQDWSAILHRLGYASEEVVLGKIF